MLFSLVLLQPRPCYSEQLSADLFIVCLEEMLLKIFWKYFWKASINHEAVKQICSLLSSQRSHAQSYSLVRSSVCPSQNEWQTHSVTGVAQNPDFWYLLKSSIVRCRTSRMHTRTYLFPHNLKIFLKCIRKWVTRLNSSITLMLFYCFTLNIKRSTEEIRESEYYNSEGICQGW